MTSLHKTTTDLMLDYFAEKPKIRGAKNYNEWKCAGHGTRSMMKQHEIWYQHGDEGAAHDKAICDFHQSNFKLKRRIYYSASVHNFNFIIREVIRFLRCFGCHRLCLWKGVIYLPAVLIYCQMTQLVQMFYLFFLLYYWAVAKCWNK